MDVIVQYVNSLSIDWPDVIAGVVLSTLAGGIGVAITQLWRFVLARREVVKYGRGTWYSVEYDPKGNVSRDDRPTYLMVDVQPSLTGKVTIRSKKEMNPRPKPVATGWVAWGKINSGVLVGKWKSTVPNTKRFGVGMLQFQDKGRAVGYWLGVREGESPVYGYWIMTRDFDELKSLVQKALPPGSFFIIDVARKLADAERGSKGARI